ncbi:hypothetical protein LCGC14_0523110 [marine sediment metagenome]|uniref:Uncharacterized protein n=1 Tax=marine sediment metagenome TaxID=412755 RepID=A0A0F9RY02_9ZZZZ
MTVYPFEIDSDADIIRVDDNITEVGGEAINQSREAIFAIETELGVRPSGSVSSVAARLDASLNQDGTIKSSALTSVGLVTLPITNNQVSPTAGIQEIKLALDHSTSDLSTLIVANSALLNSLTAFANATDSDLNTHIAGGSLLTDGSAARHVASHIDLNGVPVDARDLSYTWGGLLNKAGTPRSALTVAQALDQINTDFVGHQNAIAGAHVASAVDVDTDEFLEIPQTVDTVQKFIDYVDEFEVITIADHRATSHANGVSKIGRITSNTLPDGYGQNVVPNTPVKTFLVRSPNIVPVDNISSGDDLVTFHPVDNSDFSFDAQFSQVNVGDIIRINYGSGFEASFKVDSVRFTPASEWVVRINGTNLVNNSDGYVSARIDRSLYDLDTVGILAVAAANATPTGSFDTILSSVIVAHPRSAMALGNGFDPGQLDASHYNLYLELYPSGNPSDRVVSMPVIDITGNLGVTPGRYTLESIVHETNKQLREIGYNFRFIAFAHEGNFGIMLADAISAVSFSITSGSISLGALGVGTFTNNVIGDAAATGFDALGLGNTHTDLASPAFGSTLLNTSVAQLPTKVIVPFKSRDYIVDGQRLEAFAPTWLATEDINKDGYWDGYISDRTVVGALTVETTYTVPLDLKPAGLKPGKTIVIQPAIPLTDANYFDVDYGRFIIKSVVFPPICAGVPAQTLITVINSLHASGSGTGFSSSPTFNVKLYFSEDSVDFNNEHIIAQTPTSLNYHRLHEIFVNSQGATFSHERARMTVQSESGALLRSDIWHIEDVSPKLRGYRDSTTTFNKFIRFYILSYDSGTGEYDGYIGQRAPSGNAILNAGPATRGRKEIPTRFYDETNVDFIDLTFVEESLTLASSIDVLPTAAPRYVDIEIFDTLKLNDDLLLLATVEVNWDPTSGQEIIQRVINRKQIGSIDEGKFTQSAVDFITAGDRALHENGIIRGFDFDFINTDNREIFYKGGMALVNGRMVAANAISVTIPEIAENPNSIDSIDWAVCVNEEGFLEPIIVTPTKQQFFAIENTSGSTYYVPSVTFTELVETRKDLVPIAVVTAAIASITITDSDVVDVRRIITDGGRSDLTLAPDGYVGQFDSFSKLENWANQYAAEGTLKVKVRGVFNLASSVTLGLTSPVIFEGDGATINVTADKGIILSDDVTFKNITFNYNPDVSGITFVSAADKINGTNGCIYSTGSRDGVTIEDCVFNSVLSATQRPPFISFELDQVTALPSHVLSNVSILRNKFNDSGSGAVTRQSAVAIVSLNSAATIEPVVIRHIRISDNICDKFQGIYVTQETESISGGAGEAEDPGIRAFDTVISGNNCGAIGVLTTSISSTETTFVATDRDSGIIVRDNTANLIGHMISSVGGSGVGTQILLAHATPFPAGHLEISSNHCNVIFVSATDNDVSANTYGGIVIDKNRVTATDPTFLNNWAPTNYFGASSTSGQLFGIFADDAADNKGNVIISNNMLHFGIFDAATYYFLTGISTSVSATITNNIIHNSLRTGGASIGIQAAATTAGLRQYYISGNRITRGSSTISNYIVLDTDNTRAMGTVVDNIFDSETVDGSSDDETITGTGTSPASNYADTFIVERNKNQTATVLILTSQGHWQSPPATLAPWTDITNLSVTSAGGLGGITNTHVGLVAAGTVSASSLDWVVSLENIIPVGTYVVTVAMTAYKASAAVSGTGDIELHSPPGSTTGTPTWDYGAQTLFDAIESVITTPDKSYKPGAGLALRLDNNSLAFSGVGTLNFSPVTVTYRW